MKVTTICTRLALALCGGWALAQQPSEPLPQKSDLVETAERRLIQLDVSFEAKRRTANDAIVPLLRPEDFELIVNTGRVAVRYADRICRIDEREVTTETEDAGAAPVAAAPRGTYIFYLEHKLLTMRGQNIAFEMVESMIKELVVHGNRGMLVSSGGAVLQSPVSTEPEVLIAFLQKVRTDPKQWAEFEYAQGESERHRQIQEQPTTGGQQIAARAFQLEEMRITSNRMQRLAALIGGLSEIDPPKAIFYFSDIARQKPGQHFVDLFSGQEGTPEGFDSPFNHTTAFDHVLEEANAQGVRLYTIQAQGIQVGETPAGGSFRNTTLTGLRRIEEAENTLRSFSAETGGEMFFGGDDATTMRRIVKSIERDFDCFYVLSFPADGLPEDGPMRVVVRLNPDTEAGANAERDFKVRTRGQLVVQSESRRTESKLLAAHLSTGTLDGDIGRGAAIPLGYRNGKFEALVQFVVRTPDLPPGIVADSLWDLGMTKISGVDVTGDISARIGTDNPSAPVILETRWDFEPGKASVMAVGHEQRLGQLATAKLELDWPDPDKSALSVSPIAAVQPHDGAFLEKAGGSEKTRLQGPIALSDGVALVDRPLALVGLVCRSKKMKDDVWIVRELSGGSTVEFPPIRWTFEGERCIHLRDVLKNGQMGWGDYVYDIKVFENEAMTGPPAASGQRVFSAAEVPENRASSPDS